MRLHCLVFGLACSFDVSLHEIDVLSLNILSAVGGWSSNLESFLWATVWVHKAYGNLFEFLSDLGYGG